MLILAAILATFSALFSGPVSHPADFAPIVGAPAWAPVGMVPCGREDVAGPCYWDATRHNGEGQSFFVIRLDDTHSSLTYPFAPALDKIVEN